MRYLITSLLAAVALSSTSAHAATAVSHLTLIGVISDGQAGSQGVAVVKDATLKKTLMLRRGDVLPDGSGFVVRSIDRKFVLVSNGVETARVEHAPTQPEDKEARKPDGTPFLSEEDAMKVFDGDSDLARARLERLLQPFGRRTLVTPTADEDDEPITFEKLKADLLEIPADEDE